MIEPAALLDAIKLAVAAVNAAEQSLTTAQAEHVSRSNRVGMLLLEAKKLHPEVRDFDAFLKKVNLFRCVCAPTYQPCRDECNEYNW